MLHIRYTLMSLLLIFTFLGCTNQDSTNSPPSPNAVATVSPKPITPPSNLSQSEPKSTSKPTSTSAKAIYVGDIKELEDSICGETRLIYAYGETSNYQVYICADANAPNRPRYYLSRNKDGSGSLAMEATNYNPQKVGAIEFQNEGYLYTLESPTTQKPEPVLRVTFPNGKLSEEQLLRYLSRSPNTNTSNNSTPSSAATPLQYVLQNRENLGICKDNFRAGDGQKGMGSKAFQINDKRYLVQVQCFFAAYQGAFAYVLWIDESPKPRLIPLQFDIFQESKDGAKPNRVTEDAIVGSPEFNVKLQTMTNFTKFRGIGDCGSSAIYKLEGDRFILQKFRAKYACDGKYIKDFPIIYP